MAETSTSSILTDIFAAPAEAFAAIRERPRAWLPLLLLIAGYCAISLTYMTSVDLPWFMERQLQNAANMTAAQREQAIEASTRVSPWVYGSIGAASSTLFILLWFTIISLYYTAVSFFTSDGVKFKQWFGLVAWCALPAVFGLLASLVNVLASDARFMPQDELNPLSFGNLLSIDRSGLPILQQILLSLDVSLLWSLVLSVLGYQAWTKRSLPTSAGIVLGPFVLIVAIGVYLASR